MSFGDLKELPHLVKPITLGLSIVLFIFVLVAEASWYPILIACAQLVFTIAMMLSFAFEVPFTQSLAWPKIEMFYSIVWTILAIVGGIIMFVQVFNNKWFAAIVSVGLFALTTVIWAFNALQFWRGGALTATTTTTSSTNQATAQPPYPGSGVNPGV